MEAPGSLTSHWKMISPSNSLFGIIVMRRLFPLSVQLRQKQPTCDLSHSASNPLGYLKGIAHNLSHTTHTQTQFNFIYSRIFSAVKCSLHCSTVSFMRLHHIRLKTERLLAQEQHANETWEPVGHDDLLMTCFWKTKLSSTQEDTSLSKRKIPLLCTR